MSSMSSDRRRPGKGAASPEWRPVDDRTKGRKVVPYVPSVAGAEAKRRNDGPRHVRVAGSSRKVVVRQRAADPVRLRRPGCVV